MEIDSKRTKILEEETQDSSMFIITTTAIESDLAESAPASVSHFKIPAFLLKTFRKRFDDIHENGNSSEIEKKKRIVVAPEKLYEVASMIYRIFGGGKFSACGIGSKVDGEDGDCSSESEAGEDYPVEKIFATESETEKKFGRDLKISSQSRVPTSILDLISKRNPINFNFNFDFCFDFIKSKICKGKIGNRNSNLRENPNRLHQIRSRERKQMIDENREELWQKRILMGEKCKPLSASASLRCNQNGVISPSIRH